MTQRPVLVTDLDLALLRAIDREGSVAAACRALGIPRDRGVYRIARLGRRLPGGVLTARRGGAGRGSSRLTDAARRLSETGPEGRPMAGALGAALRGTYRIRPDGHVVVGGQPVYVDFVAREGERVGIALDPEAIVVARGRFDSSARNVWSGVVRSVGPSGARCTAVVRALGRNLPVALTRASVERLGLRPGRRVYLYVKATALRRAITP
jgi:molybdopterin-binding protein/molybdate transport repressor ModE-like protein